MSCFLEGHVGALLTALGSRKAVEEEGIGSDMTLAECVAIHGEARGQILYRGYAGGSGDVTEENPSRGPQSGSPVATTPAEPLPSSTTTPATTDPQVTPPYLRPVQGSSRGEAVEGGKTGLFDGSEEEGETPRGEATRESDGVGDVQGGVEDLTPEELDSGFEEMSSVGDGEEVIESQLDAEVGDVYIPPIGTTPPWEDPRRRRIFNSPRAGRIECFYLEEDGERTRICEQGGARLRWVPRELVARHRGPAGSAELFDRFGDDEEEERDDGDDADLDTVFRRRCTIPVTPRGRRRRVRSSPKISSPLRFIESNVALGEVQQGQAKRLKRSMSTTSKRASNEGISVTTTILQQWKLFEFLCSASPTQWVRENIVEASDPEIRRIVKDGSHGIIPDEELMILARDGCSKTPAVRIAALMALLSSGTATQNGDRCGTLAATVIEELNSGTATIDMGIVILLAVCRQISESISAALVKNARALTVFTLAALVRVRVLWSALDLPLPLGLGQAVIEVSEEEVLRDVRFKNATLGERLTGGLLVVCGKCLMIGSPAEMKLATILPWLAVSGAKPVVSYHRPSEEGVLEPSEPSALFTRSDRFPESAILYACRAMISAGGCSIAVSDSFTPTHSLQVEVYYKLLLENGCDKNSLFMHLEQWSAGSPQVANSLLEIIIRDYPQRCHGTRLWEKVDDADLYRLISKLPASGKLEEGVLRRLTPPRTWLDRVRLSPKTVEVAWDLSRAITEAFCHTRALDDGKNRQEMEAAVQFLVDTLPGLLRTGDIRPGLLLHCGGLLDPRHIMTWKTKYWPEPRLYWTLLSNERLLNWYADNKPEAEILRYARDHSGIRTLPPALFTTMSDNTRRTASIVAELFYAKLLEVWKNPDVERGLHRATVLRWIFTQAEAPPEASIKCIEGCYKDALLNWLTTIPLRPPAFVINRIQSLID